MYCEKCGNQIKDDAKFCVSCGVAVQNTKSETMNIGEKNDDLKTGTEHGLAGKCVSKIKDRVYYCGGKICFLIPKLICIIGLLMVILTQNICMMSYGDLEVENGDSVTIHYLVTENIGMSNMPVFTGAYVLSRIAAFSALIFAVISITEYQYVVKKIIMPITITSIVLVVWSVFVFIIYMFAFYRDSDLVEVESDIGWSPMFIIMLILNVVFIVYLKKIWVKFKEKEARRKYSMSVEIIQNEKNVKLDASPSMDDDGGEYFINQATGEIYRSISTRSKKQLERLADKAVFELAEGSGTGLGIWKCSNCGTENDISKLTCSKCYCKRD